MADVGLQAPEQRHGRVHLVQDALGEHLHSAGDAWLGWQWSRAGPLAVPCKNLFVEAHRLAELGVNGRAAHLSRVRVVDEPVSAGPGRNGDILLSMGRQRPRKIRDEEQLAGRAEHLLELVPEGGKDARGVELPVEEFVAGQAMPSRVAPGRDARGVYPGHRGEHRVVVRKAHPRGGEGRQVRHQVGRDLGQLEPVEYEDNYAIHFADRPSTRARSRPAWGRRRPRRYLSAR